MSNALPARLSAAGRKYGLAARVAVRNRWQYPAEQLGPLFTYCLFVFIQARIWAVAYAGKAEICGYSQAASTWYFMLAELVLMSANGSFGQLARDIKDGQVAYTLGRPFGFVLWNGAQRLGLGLSQAAFFLLPGALIAGLAVGPLPPTGPVQVVAVVLSVAFSLAVQYFLQAAIAMTAFWFEENSAFMWIYSKIALVAGTLMPIEFLPSAWQAVLWWTPFPWIGWAPARLAVLPCTPADIIRILGGQLSWLVASALIAGIVFRLAVRRTTVQGG